MNDYEPASQSPVGSASATTAVQERRPSARRLLSKRTGAWFVAAGLTCAVAGLTGAGTASAADLPIGGGPVAAPSDGGATGIVDAKSASSFSVTTAAGVEVTVNLAASAFETAAEPKKIVLLPGGHFAAYTGAGFVAASSASRDWFVEHL
ncbi:MAG TPA: hypothetical protein VGP60_40180, partial [Amycolatopsis sp.]|nr:hypothetical protein [Amycolatopsis sp.]